MLLLSCFSHVQLCVTPKTAAHQAPPSLGFSRQEHWSGLPFPSPMHESEKWKWSRSVVSNSLQPHGLQPTRLLRPWDFPGKGTGEGCHCLLWFYSIVLTILPSLSYIIRVLSSLLDYFHQYSNIQAAISPIWKYPLFSLPSLLVIAPIPSYISVAKLREKVV